MKGVQAAVLGGSALVLLILALRLTLKNHLPRRLLPALWCVAALRFLLPVEIPTRLSVWNLLRGTAEAQTAPIAASLLPFPQLSASQTAAEKAKAMPQWARHRFCLFRSCPHRRLRLPPLRGRTGGCWSGSGVRHCLPCILGSATCV